MSLKMYNVPFTVCTHSYLQSYGSLCIFIPHSFPLDFLSSVMSSCMLISDQMFDLLYVVLSDMFKNIMLSYSREHLLSWFCTEVGQILHSLGGDLLRFEADGLLFSVYFRAVVF